MNEESRWYPFFAGVLLTILLLGWLAVPSLFKEGYECSTNIRSLTTAQDSISFMETPEYTRRYSRCRAIYLGD